MTPFVNIDILTLKKLPCYSILMLKRNCTEKRRMRMGKKKILLVITFVVITMVSGAMVSIYEMNKGSVEVKGAAQAEIVDMAQPENEKTTQADIKSAVQTDKMMFSCGVSGCTRTEVHQHGHCGIEGCMQIGEHSHGICGVAGCREAGTHMHNGEYCYPHSANDVHAYHNCGVSGCTEVKSHTHNSCGVSGCTEMGSHTHNSCGVAGCTQIGEHSHGGNGGGHHQSGHGGGHH